MRNKVNPILGANLNTATVLFLICIQVVVCAIALFSIAYVLCAPAAAVDPAYKEEMKIGGGYDETAPGDGGIDLNSDGTIDANGAIASDASIDAGTDVTAGNDVIAVGDVSGATGTFPTMDSDGLTSSQSEVSIFDVTPTKLNIGGSAAIDLSGTGLATIIKGTLNVDEPATFDSTGSFSEKLTTAATIAGQAGFRLQEGTPPSSPAEGDFWIDTADGLMYYRDASGAPASRRILDTGDWAAPGNIGTGTPGTGAFTALSASGNFSADGTITVGDGVGSATLNVDGAAGSGRIIDLLTNGTKRWRLFVNTDPESTGDAGSNFQVRAFADNGSAIDDPISIDRVAGGDLTISRPLILQDTIDNTTDATLSIFATPTTLTIGSGATTMTVATNATNLFLGGGNVVAANGPLQSGSVGVDTTQGTLRAYNRSDGTPEPAVINMYSENDTPYWLYISNEGALFQHDSRAEDDGDGFLLAAPKAIGHMHDSDLTGGTVVPTSGGALIWTKLTAIEEIVVGDSGLITDTTDDMTIQTGGDGSYCVRFDLSMSNSQNNNDRVRYGVVINYATDTIANVNNVAPITIDSTSAHGLVTGQKVAITGTGIDEADTSGTENPHTITFVDADTFSLDGTSADGAAAGGTWSVAPKVWALRHTGGTQNVGSMGDGDQVDLLAGDVISFCALNEDGARDLVVYHLSVHVERGET